MGQLATLIGKILGKGAPSTQSTAGGSNPPAAAVNPSAGDSAAMNVWLHRQVIVKISENGGKVPQELLKF